MIIETKFNLGDRVFVVSTGTVEKVVACELCSDKKVVTLSGTEYKCPRCSQGSGFVKCFSRYMVIASGRIGKIEVERYGDKRVATEYYANKIEEKYMLDSTGIGSGSNWPVESLFATEKEAKAFCDAENKKKEESGY